MSVHPLLRVLRSFLPALWMQLLPDRLCPAILRPQLEFLSLLSVLRFLFLHPEFLLLPVLPFRLKEFPVRLVPLQLLLLSHFLPAPLSVVVLPVLVPPELPLGFLFPLLQVLPTQKAPPP